MDQHSAPEQQPDPPVTAERHGAGWRARYPLPDGRWARTRVCATRTEAEERGYEQSDGAWGLG